MGQKMTNIKSGIPSINGWKRPLIFNLSNQEDVAALEELKAGNKISYLSDEMGEALEELYHIENPSQIDSMDQKVYETYLQKFGNGDTDMYGSWIFFPWDGTLVHFPAQEDLRRLRGSRNRNLITEDERQDLVNNKTILVLGLSVGSNVIDSLLMQGVGSKYILVDMDHLGPTNLNRIRASYHQVGIHKVDLVAKKISQLDPYLEQVHYKNGIDETNLEEILKNHKPDIIVDEMDSLRMKIIIRQKAQELGIPVLMATDDGDDILLDIERYDQVSQLPILHGILPEQVIEDILENKQMNRSQAGAIIGKYFVNLENVPVRMIESLLEVGKTLPSWPQLGGAAVLSGLYVAYAAKKILLGQPINSGRFLMGPEEQLNPEIKSEAYKNKKTELIKIMMGGNR